jgi:hypothetical protein
MKKMSHINYLRLLEPWVKASEKYLYYPPDRSDLLCYGTGYNGWGVQTHQKAFAAFAVLAADPDTDEERVGFSRTQLLDMALKMLRFNLESHIEGSYNCMEGESWGHTWISALGIERMMHGVEAIEEYLTAQDWHLLKKVLVSECDWLLDHYKVAAGPIQNNKPESNLWNGSILHRTAVMYPETTRAEEYREKGSSFLFNSISVASDASLQIKMDGKTASEWYIGNNFFETYSLNHHGYLNVGYMAICLSNVAMLHFMYKKRGLKAPDSLYHHAEDLWRLVKECIFHDGRLLRIGGDTRVRYCYCQDYAIPMWLLIQDKFGDKYSVEVEASWLDIVAKEVEHNGDGSYLSDRCSELERRAPIYYTRLESDRAVALSYGAYWRRVFDNLPGDKDKTSAIEEYSNWRWQDEYHGACLVKGKNRIASWTWRAGELPQGLCLPPFASDLAEWRYNLAGRIKGTGTYNYNEVLTHKEYIFEGGFLTTGSFRACSEELVSEQQTKDILSVSKLIFAALPDDRTVIVMQRAETINRSYISSIQGLLLHIPNDLFNDNSRRYYYEDGMQVINGVGSKEELIDIDSPWVNVDDLLSVIKVYGDDSLKLHCPGRRQIGLRNRIFEDTMGMLYADEICCPYYKGLMDVNPGQIIYNTGFIVQSNVDHKFTKDYSALGCCSELRINENLPEISVIKAIGADKRTYILVSNMGENTSCISLTVSAAKAARDLVKGEETVISEGLLSLKIEGNSAKLMEIL